MNFRWLKNYMPRGLYGRALLILIVPILAIQLIVSVAFIQRYFADVTQQMTTNLSYDLELVLDAIAVAPDIETAVSTVEALAPALNIQVDLPASEDVVPYRAFYDVSGLSVAATLRDRLDGVGDIDLGPNQNIVRFEVDTAHGPAVLAFGRERVSASNPHQLLVIIVLAGILMTIIAYLFLRNQLRPIKRLADAAAAFGKGRSEPYHPRGAIEVRAAGNAFLDMRARLERQMEQRTLMLSGVSHDLRTPLTRMKLGLSMLDDADGKALVADVDEMERLIDAFLDFARGDALEEVSEVDPAALVRAAVEDARRMGRAVDLGAVEGQGTVKLRATAVRRALDNLIGNAVRYGNRAVVSMHLGDRALRLRVEDDGPGIPKDLREKAVQPFQRLEPGRNQNRGSGVGLGLAIAFDIARSHGGTLRLDESADLGGLQADLVLAR